MTPRVLRLRDDVLVRLAVILVISGLLLLIPVLLTINALAVGLFMLGSLLVPAAIVLYVVAVIRDLKGRRAL